MSEICPFCAVRPATLLCDYTIGFLWSGETAPIQRGVTLTDGRIVARPTGEAHRVIDGIDADHFTCDRPMCAECAVNKGWIHYGRKGGFDSIDLCQQCAQLGESRTMNALTKTEADAVRVQMWKRSAGMIKTFAIA